MMQPSSALITLRLAKFSYAEDAPPEAQQFTWRHVTQDLVVVFDTFRGGDSASSAQMLKVLQGTRVLEEIAVESMINQGNRVIETLRQHHVEVKNEQLPISALARCPLFAIRYHLPPEKKDHLNDHEAQRAVKIRRIQLKFASNQEYDTAFHHLHQLGLRISQQPTPPPSAANSASSGTSKVESTGPSCPPSRLAEISNRPHTAVSASLPPFTHRSVALPSQSQPQEVNIIRPTSAYSALVNRERNPHCSMNPPHSDPLIPPEYFPRPASSASVLSLPSSSTATTMWDRFSDLPTIEENTSVSTPRPGSAMLFSRPDTSQLTLPPRRELPFGRSSPPKSSGSDGSRPSSGTMGPPPLPCPSRTVCSSLSSSQAPNQGLDIPPMSLLPQPTITEDTRKESHVRSSSRGSDLPPLPRPTIIEEAGKQVRMSSLLPLTKSMPPSGPTKTHPLSEFNMATQHRRQSQPRDALPTPPRSEATYQDRIVSELYNSDLGNANEGLAAYAMQSEDGRMTVLNDFMMQHIDDDNFLTLVDDVSVCWTRIGLGLGLE